MSNYFLDPAFLLFIGKICLAMVLGLLLGLERIYAHKTVGLRTYALVTMSTCFFIIISIFIGEQYGSLGDSFNPAYIAGTIISGIGFLGAGVIMREEGSVRGINTAATLWASGAVGACAGADLILEASLATAFIIAANTLLRPIVGLINGQPLDTDSVEVTNSVYIITPKHAQKLVLRQFIKTLEDAGYQTQDIEVHQFGDDDVEIQAVLTASAVDGGKMDQLIEKIANQDFVNQAFWSPSTTD